MQHNNNFSSLVSTNSFKDFLKKELGISNKAIKDSFISKLALQMQISEKKPLSIPLNLCNRFGVNPVYSGKDIEIIDENEIFIVINKPAGIHGHPLDYQETNTALNFLRSHYNLASLGRFKDNYEKGLLYRLDKETSGVLIYVKDELVHQNLRDSFSHIAKEKKYMAVVEGELTQAMSLSDKILASGIKGEKMIVSDSGVQANLDIRPLFYSEEKNSTLVEVSLAEGHRHQIRVQLSSNGFPIVGDNLYNEDSIHEVSRLFLHAFEYSLDVNGQKSVYRATDADLFCDFLNINSLVDMSR